MYFRKKVFAVSAVALVVLMLSAVFASPAVHYSGLPKLNRIYYKGYAGAGPEVIAQEFIQGVTDFIPGPGRKDLMESVDPYGKIYMVPMAEFAAFWINCRSYKETSGLPNTPLNYSAFRLALSYIYGVSDKATDIFNYVRGDWTYAIDNPVPPAQKPWHNASIKMPYATSYEQAWQILYNAGFRVIDGRLVDPKGNPLRELTVHYSTGAIYWRDGPGMGFVRNFNEFLEYIGATESPKMKLVPKDFIPLVYDLLLYHDFDIICIGLTNLGRFVDWLYDLLNSENIGPWGWNVFGIKDPRLDSLTRIILTDLDVNKVLWAASQVQRLFVEELMPWFPVSSGSAIATFAWDDHPSGDLGNVVPMNNFGVLNDWTFMGIHWVGGPGTIWPGGSAKFALADKPSNLNPYYEDTLYGWQFLDRAIQGLIGVAPMGGDPAQLMDIPYIATHFEIAHWVSIPELGITKGSMATFYLRQDVKWQDYSVAVDPFGGHVTAYDCVANMLFLKKWKPGRYSSTWANLVYSEADGPYKFNTYFYDTSLYYAYYVAGTSLLAPKRVIDRLEALIKAGVIPSPRHWNPAAMTYREFMGIDPPAKYSFMKAIVGCGPYIFNFYDYGLQVGQVERFEEFFVNAPALGAVVGEWRVSPGATYTYKVLIQNLMAKVSTEMGDLATITVDVRVYEDGILKRTIEDVTLPPFDFKYFGPYTTDPLTKGIRSIKVEVYDSETGTKIHEYTHRFVVTIREDVTSYAGDIIDIKVDIRDVSRAAAAFGSMPGHPRWEPSCDVNDDFKVNIRDISAVASKFGWK